MRARLQSPILPYAIAVGASIAVAGIRLALSPVLLDTAPFVPFIIPVILAAWFGGLWPGLAATFLSATVGSYLFIPPYHSFHMAADEQAAIALFLVTAILVSLLCDALRQAWTRLDRERTRAAESEGRLAATLSSIRDSFVTIDPEWRFTYANPEALRVCGLRPSEMLGHAVWELFAPARGTAIEAELRRVMTQRVTAEFEAFYPPWQRWFAVRAFPVEDGSVAAYALEITARKRADEAARAAQQQLRMVTESMPLPVTRCSRDLRYLWVNRSYAAWLGRSHEEIIGRRIEEVIGPAAMTTLRPHFERVLAGETVHYEEQVQFRGPGLRWVSAVYTPTVDAVGEIDGWVAVVQDVDERKRSEEALREADRRKDAFLATLAHELRNPLAPISNAIYLLRRRGPADPEVEWGHDLIERQLGHLTRLVDDLLDLSRITRGKIELQRGRVPVSTFVGAALETSQPLLEAAGHMISVSQPEEKLFVDGDHVRLAQVITNLLNNAAKYTRWPGRIALIVEREQDQAVVRVCDNGVGIAPELLPRVFEMFTQGDGGPGRSSGGLGIGLTLARQLVEMHGGTIEAHSEGAGRGSEFVVRLPLALWEPAPALAAAAAAEAPPSYQRRILVVDDNRDAAESLARLLRGEGHEVLACYDGVAGVLASAQFEPEVVLLDLGMPAMSGYEVAKRLRTLPGGGALLIIALTGWGQAEDRRRSREAGFDHHLTKPLDVAALRRILDGVKTAT